MPKPRVLFGSQIVKKDQPLELLPAKNLSFSNGDLELYEMDSFVRNGKKVVETKKPRDKLNSSLMGRFKVEVKDGRFTKVKERPLLSRGRGVYHGWWGDMRLVHYVDMSEVKGSWRGKPLKGTIKDERLLHFGWEFNGKKAEIYLEYYPKDQILKGFWWYEGQRAISETKPDRVVYLKRREEGPPETQPGLKIPVRFHGLSDEDKSMFVPLEEVQEEFVASLQKGRTRKDPTSVYIEVGILCIDPATAGTTQAQRVTEDYYAEVQLPYDTELERALSLSAVFLRGWLLGAEMVEGPKDPWLQKSLTELGPLACPGEEDPWACEEFQQHYQNGIEAGKKAKLQLHPSIALRLASVGLQIGQTNPFDDYEIPWFEARWYAKQTQLKDSDPKSKDPVVHAYHQGRLLNGLLKKGATSADGEIPDELLWEAMLAGVDPADASSFYIAGFHAADDARREALIKSYASLGFDENTKNPYLGNPAKKVDCEAFKEFQELLKSRNPDVVRAFGEGQAVHEIYSYGFKVGKGAFDPEPGYVQERTKYAKIPAKNTQLVYESGVEAGRLYMRQLRIKAWFGNEDNIKRFNTVLQKHLQTCKEDEDRNWGSIHNYNSERFTYVGGEIGALRAAALQAGVPLEVFDRAKQDALWDMAQENWHNDSWGKRFEQKFVDWIVIPGQLAHYFSLCAVDALLNIGCDEDALRSTYSDEYIKLSREMLKEYSAFAAIQPGMSDFEVWGMFALGLADVVLSASMLTLGGKLAACSLFDLKKGGLALIRNLAVGGARWAAENWALLAGNVVMSTGLGFAEEWWTARIDGREFQGTAFMKNTLRNSVMFLAFQGLMAYGEKVLAMSAQLPAVLFFDQAVGGLRAAVALKKAAREGDEDAHKEALKALVQVGFMTLLMAGGVWIRKVSASRSLRSKHADKGLQQMIVEFSKARAKQIKSKPPKKVAVPKDLQQKNDAKIEKWFTKQKEGKATHDKLWNEYQKRGFSTSDSAGGFRFDRMLKMIKDEMGETVISGANEKAAKYFLCRIINQIQGKIYIQSEGITMTYQEVAKAILRKNVSFVKGHDSELTVSNGLKIGTHTFGESSSTLNSVCGTMIHEYTHSRQSRLAYFKEKFSPKSDNRRRVVMELEAHLNQRDFLRALGSEAGNYKAKNANLINSRKTDVGIKEKLSLTDMTPEQIFLEKIGISYYLGAKRGPSIGKIASRYKEAEYGNAKDMSVLLRLLPKNDPYVRDILPWADAIKSWDHTSQTPLKLP